MRARHPTAPDDPAVIHLTRRVIVRKHLCDLRNGKREQRRYERGRAHDRGDVRDFTRHVYRARDDDDDDDERLQLHPSSRFSRVGAAPPGRRRVQRSARTVPSRFGRVPFTKHPIRTCGNESTAPRDEVVSILKCPRNSHRRRARERARERATSKETFIVDAILTRTSVGGERPRRPGSRNSTREISNSRGNLLRASPTRHASALNASVAHRDGKKTVKVSMFTPLVASDWLAFERAIVGRVRDKNEESNERMVRAFRAFFSIC